MEKKLMKGMALAVAQPVTQVNPYLRYCGHCQKNVDTSHQNWFTAVSDCPECQKPWDSSATKDDSHEESVTEVQS